jgi:hypothetical protein
MVVIGALDFMVSWRTIFVLPTWYKVAAEVAYYISAAVRKRILFITICMYFDKQQQKALNDYKEASVRIRYNDNFRNKIFFGY